MDVRFWMTLLLAMVVVVEPSAIYGGGEAHYQHGSTLSHVCVACNGQVGDGIGKVDETIVASEGRRRTLGERHRLISLRVFKKNHIPCHHRGQSYYDCYFGGTASY